MIYTYIADTSLVNINPNFKHFVFNELFYNRILTAKSNLTKLYNIYNFIDELVDPISINYYSALNRFSIHPGYNRIFASKIAGKTEIESLIFSQIRIENMKITKYKIFKNIRLVKKDISVVFSPINSLLPHLEYKADKDTIDYYAGLENDVRLKFPDGREFIVGHSNNENRIDLDYNQDLSITENLKIMFDSVIFNKNVFLEKNGYFLESRQQIKDQWYD